MSSSQVRPGALTGPVVVLLASVALVGCGGRDSDTAASSQSVSVAAATPSASASASPSIAPDLESIDLLLEEVQAELASAEQEAQAGDTISQTRDEP